MTLSIALLAGCNTDTDGPTIDPTVNEQIENAEINEGDTENEANEEIIQEEENNASGTEGSEGPTYTDPTYNFSLTFPKTWEDYKTSETTYDWGEPGENKTIGFRNGEEFFSISIHEKDQWKEIQAMDIKSKPDFLAENDDYVYASMTHSSKDKESVQNILKTFKAE